MASLQSIYLPSFLIVQEFIFLKKQSIMAYNEHLAERIKQNLESRKIKYIEKKMFGGVCLMVDDKMLMGVMKEQLMARVDPEVDAPKALKRKGAVTMDFTGKTMKGFILAVSYTHLTLPTSDLV